MRGLLAVFVAYGGLAKAQHFSMPVALATGDLAGYRVSSAIDTNADGMLCGVASTATASMPPVRGVLSKPLGGHRSPDTNGADDSHGCCHCCPGGFGSSRRRPAYVR